MIDKELFEWLKAFANKQPHGEYLEKWERILELVELNIWD
jgi:hypothetical protein